MPVSYENIKLFDYQRTILKAVSRDGISCHMEVVPRPFFPEFAPEPPPPPFKESEVPSIFSKPVEFVDISIVGAGK